MKQLSDKQIRFNQSLWRWYPLGQVDAIWALVEHLSSGLGEDDEYRAEINDVFDALHRLDERIRANEYPFPEKKAKRITRRSR